MEDTRRLFESSLGDNACQGIWLSRLSEHRGDILPLAQEGPTFLITCSADEVQALFTVTVKQTWLSDFYQLQSPKSN